VDSEIYICNAAVVAASAIEGHIADPRPYLLSQQP
jgi:3-isopropylmalate/(R)-2-methylmalate dehydratase large subunit